MQVALFNVCLRDSSPDDQTLDSRQVLQMWVNPGKVSNAQMLYKCACCVVILFSHLLLLLLHHDGQRVYCKAKLFD